ncbi:MAG TPA: hypothetical protein VIL36_17340, partial [Acidimicrobiales bacterium]
MSSLTGTGALIRLVVRRDRLRIFVWVVAIVAVVVAVASSITGLYTTSADLREAAATVEGDAAQIALNGPDRGLDRLGGRVAFEVWNFGLVGVALMSLFMLGRHTRSEEETGRTELVRAMPVGRHAPTAAALTVVAAMNLLVAAGVALGLTLQDLPARGSLTLGAALGAVGLVFAAAATVAAQVTENTRVAYGITGAGVAAAFVVRAIGDVGAGTVSWLSPMGWAQASRPFVGERWWPLGLAVGVAAGLVAGAGALAARRDVGGGLVPPRPGPATASPALGSPAGLAWRLQRGGLVGWSVGVLGGGAAIGSVGKDVEDVVGDNQNVRDVFAQAGGDVTDSFFATFLLLLALIGAGYAVSSAARLRSEETALRAEPILATPVSRPRWAASHLTLALAGSVVVLAAAGLGTGMAYGITAGDMGQVPRLLGAALAYTPAVWVLVGLTVALFGLTPRATPAVWGGLAACVVIGLLGPLLALPGPIRDLSPFHHVPHLPAAELTVVPLAVLT